MSINNQGSGTEEEPKVNIIVLGHRADLVLNGLIKI